MKGIITLRKLSEGYIKEKLQAFSNSDAVKNVTTKEKYTIAGKGSMWQLWILV